MKDPRDLIDGYLDDTLTADELTQLSHWIKSDPNHAQVFAQAALLHDRLHDTFMNQSLANQSSSEEPMRTISTSAVTPKRLRRVFSTWSTAASLAAICFGLGILWLSLTQSTASAAIGELNRLIVKNNHSKDRTYTIIVEEIYAPPPRGDRPPLRETTRPPKPPLDGALLHVRDNNQFVLSGKRLMDRHSSPVATARKAGL